MSSERTQRALREAVLTVACHPVRWYSKHQSKAINLWHSMRKKVILSQGLGANAYQAQGSEQTNSSE